ncbi:hypothetical protein CW304_30720 [Bacillus sp. UFRGS-B20]|nr:hypothetical protein CW304_30720 [Bacillus sp. UFRGS-B20]
MPSPDINVVYFSRKKTENPYFQQLNPACYSIHFFDSILSIRFKVLFCLCLAEKIGIIIIRFFFHLFHPFYT